MTLNIYLTSVIESSQMS